MTETKYIAYRKEDVYRNTRLTKSYWPGNTGDKLLDTTVADCLRKNAVEVPNRIALVEGIADISNRRRWTYAELLADAEKIAAGLLNRFKPGDRIGVMMPNIVEWVLVQYGIAIAGMTMVTINVAYHSKEIEHIIRQAEVVGIFVVPEWRDNKILETVVGLQPSLPTLKEIIIPKGLKAFMERSKAVEFPAIKPEDPHVIMFTSGTTGEPKGAILYNQAITNATRFMGIRSGLEEGGVYLSVVPMYFMSGAGYATLGALQRQATLVLAVEFNESLFLDLVESEKGTFSVLVPTMLAALLQYQNLKRFDISTLKTIQSGGSMVEARLVRRVKEELGCNITIACGQTEAHGAYTQTHLDDNPEDQAETVGQPWPLIEIKIANPETGDVLPLNTEGEICIRGYQVMLGYYNDPEGTAAAIDQKGWLHTGDMCTMDERGFVKVVGRLRDMIIRGGMNVYPAEVEQALKRHPKVRNAAVIGVPDEYWGEQVLAVVIPKSFDNLPTIAELEEYCLSTLARFKRPRFYAFIKEFPTTEKGKIQKFILKKEIRDGNIIVSQHSGK